LPVLEVLIQGNQVSFVGKLLVETYKIPKKYIKGLELAVKPKKGK
jgi:translation initiation factor 2D